MIDDDNDDTIPQGERIAKVLARAGVCSRRDAEKLIEARRVAVNGQVLTGPAVNVTADDVVTVDGAPIKAAEPARLWRYHKAPGVMTTHKDPQGRPTVFERLPREMPRVISVGRLDLNSEGLLLLTNDGDLARTLEHPSRGWMRRYRVRVHGMVDQRKLDTVADGVTVEGVQYGPVKAELERQQGSNAWIVVSIAEGKNREVRRVMEHLGYTVNRLIRVAYGPFALGRLPRGEVEEVPGKVLRDQIGGLGEEIPPELRRKQGQTEKWAKAKPKAIKPGQRARERALAKGEGFKKGEPTRTDGDEAAPVKTGGTRTAGRKPDAWRPGDRKPEARAPEGRPEKPRGNPPRDEQARPDKPRPDKPRSDKPRSDRPRADKPRDEQARPDKPRSDKPRSDKPRGDQPRSDKPRGDQPRSDKPSGDKARRGGASGKPDGARPNSRPNSGPGAKPGSRPGAKPGAKPAGRGGAGRADGGRSAPRKPKDSR
ncbi:pseudouridine synthase [Novispirillum sp. DQ9]|uniref:pseudouridine synthase n=1 Tax=Novispirillum sp. DQ9 TaxID=3398612 RepID=UPI003C7E6D41